MKKLFILFYLVCSLGYGETPQLLLHFDINKTLIAEDMTVGKSMHFIVSSLLAEKHVHRWDADLPKMSYYDYVKHLYPDNRVERNNLLERFVETVQSSDYPSRNEVSKTYEQVMEKMEGRYLIPSFVKLIQNLQEKQIPFKIILRTFGGDLRVGKITAEIDELLDHSQFKYWGKMSQKQLELNNGTIIKKIEDIYHFILESDGHIAIQDSWNEWNADKERGRSGKPFMIDLNDSSVISLFFDDNINGDPLSEFNIVAPLSLNGEPLPLEGLLGKHIFIVDTLAAILDAEDDYFLNLIPAQVFGDH